MYCYKFRKIKEIISKLENIELVKNIETDDKDIKVYIGKENNLDEDIKRCLCNELAKEIMQYVSFEKYKMAGEPWYGEVKHVATIKIIK